MPCRLEHAEGQFTVCLHASRGCTDNHFAQRRLQQYANSCNVALELHHKLEKRQIGREDAPPAIVFTAKLEVAQHYGDFCTCDDQDHKDQAKEAKEVVELVKPHGGEDEEELDEDCTKRQDPSDQDAEHWVHIPWLLRYLPGNLVGADRVFKCW